MFYIDFFTLAGFIPASHAKEWDAGINPAKLLNFYMFL